MPNDDRVLVAAPSPLGRASWGAVFAGAVIALGLTILFGLLAVAIGFRSIDPQSSSPFDGIGIGTAIWWILTSVIALGVGGFVAGRLSGQGGRVTAMAHGTAIWALLTIVSVWIASSAIGVAVNTATGAVTAVVRTSAALAGEVGGAMLPDQVDLSPELRQARDQIQKEAEKILSDADIDQQELIEAREDVASAVSEVARRPGTLDEQVDALIDQLFRNEDAIFSATERQQLVDALVARAGLTSEEAQQVATRWEDQVSAASKQVETTLSNVGSEAVQKSESALDALSTAAWYAFFASLLSLIAATSASVAGAPRHAVK